MDNQHEKITGYRDLNQSEIDLINEIKTHGAELRKLIGRLHINQDELTEQHGSPDADARRWISIGKTHLQLGIMALVRAVAKPESF